MSQVETNKNNFRHNILILLKTSITNVWVKKTGQIVVVIHYCDLSRFFFDSDVKYREYVTTGILWVYPIWVAEKSPHYPCSTLFPTLIIVFSKKFYRVWPVTHNPCKFEIPAASFPHKSPVNFCKHLQCMYIVYDFKIFYIPAGIVIPLYL